MFVGDGTEAAAEENGGEGVLMMDWRPEWVDELHQFKGKLARGSG